MPPYVILGACNPSLAHRALTTEPAIGLLLPRNVAVRAEGDHVQVEIADPVAMLGIVGNAELDAVAAEAKQRLQRVVRVVAALGQRNERDEQDEQDEMNPALAPTDH